MLYKIDESDLSRQRLLAHVLNRSSERHLTQLAPTRTGRWLDVGSGLGETTRMLTRFMAADGECVGLEKDPALVEVARGQDWAGRHVVFQVGDATQLPFEDHSFDFVFTRYLLVHLPNPLDGIREMIRVTKPGGTVLAHEPDLGFCCSYPPRPSLERIAGLCSSIFPNPQMGRKLLHLFREAGATCSRAQADIGIEYDGVDFKRLVRMNYEAVGPALVRSGRLSEVEYQDLLKDAVHAEGDPSIVMIGNPAIAVWTTR